MKRPELNWLVKFTGLFRRRSEGPRIQQSSVGAAPSLRRRLSFAAQFLPETKKPYAPASLRQSANRKGDAVRWCRHVVRLALAENWLQDELLERAFALLRGRAAQKAELFRRENVQLAGFDVFWQFLQYIIFSYGGPIVAVRDLSGCLYSSRPTTNKLRLIAEQEKFKAESQWQSWECDITGMEDQIAWMMPYRDFVRDMNHLIQVLSRPPFAKYTNV